MAFWKAKYGYSATPPDHINNIAILDDDSLFGFAEGISEFNLQGEYKIGTVSGREQAANDLMNTLGDNFNKLFGIISYADTQFAEVHDYLKNVIPSLYNACRNSYEYLFGNRISSVRGLVYLPTLKRVVYRASGSQVGIGKVLDDGSIEILYSGNAAYSISGDFSFTGDVGRELQFITALKTTEVSYDALMERENYIGIQFIARWTGTSQSGASLNVSTFGTPDGMDRDFLLALFGDYVDPDAGKSDNPYEPGGPSGPTSPDIPPGTFDDTSDPVPIPPIPTLSAADTGFTRIYNPTLSQVQDLARYLWTDTSVIETIWNHIKQFFESPMEAIIGFNLVPCRVPDGGTKNFALMFIDTGVSMNTAATQFVDVDCGTVKLDRYYGSALDQSPYTKVSCFLPYIGMVQLNTDEVMGATLGVTYRIDIVSGSCVSMITVDGNVLYQYSGHCAITIPFSAADFSNYVSAAISVAKLAIGAAVGGGIGAIASAGIDPEQQTNIIKTTTTTETITTNALTGSERHSFSTKVKEEPIDSAMTSASFLGLTPRNISNTVGEVVTSKPHVEHSGSFSGNSGYLGVRRPYLIIERPRMCMPEQYQRFNGFPAMYTQTLSSCSGFTQVQQVQLTGMTATNPEQSEILQLLKSGVIL